MPQQQTCVDCLKLSPPTESDHTLISSQFGWRLRRERLPDGNVLFEWRCPLCWAKFKELRALTVTGENAAIPADAPATILGTPPSSRRSR